MKTKTNSIQFNPNEHLRTPALLPSITVRSPEILKSRSKENTCEDSDELVKSRGTSEAAFGVKHPARLSSAQPGPNRSRELPVSAW